MAKTLTTSWQAIAAYTWTPGTGFSCTFYLDAKYSTQSTVNNNTTIQTRLNCVINQGSGSGYNYSFSCSYAPTVSGSGLWTLETETITSGGDTIKHNDDGTKTITLSATAKINAIGLNASFSGDAILPKIDRYATLTSAPDFNDEASPKITFTKNVASGATVYAGIFNSAGTTAYASYRSVGNAAAIATGEYTFNLTSAERTALRNATASSKTLQVQFKMYTTISGTNFDGGSLTKTMTIVNATPELSSPTFSEQNAKVSALLGSGGTTVVQNASTIRFGITATAKKSATITKVVATHNNQPLTDTSSPYSFDIPIKTGTITAVATDSRTNTSSTYTKTWSGSNYIEYKPVAINNLTFKRQTETSGVIILNLTATYYQKTFGSTANVPTVKWKKDNGSWTTLTSSQYSIANNQLTVSNLSLGDQVDYEHEATFYLSIEDKLSSAQDNRKVTIGIPTLELGKDDVKVNGDFTSTKLFGRTWDYGTNNTENTWVPVTSGDNKWQHRAIPTTYNSNTPQIKMETLGGRITNANISHTYEHNRAHMQLLQSSSSMTSNKPANDGYILHFSWDNNNQCPAQFYFPQGDHPTVQMQFRSATASGTWTGWEDVYRAKSLYDNSSGTTGTVNLSETSANFTYLEIYYSGGGVYASTKVYTPNNKSASLRTASQETNNITNYLNCKNVKISGTSITVSTYARSVIYSNSCISQANNGIAIYKVIGYR